MSELIKEKWTRWSLERLQFLFSHIEDFIDDDLNEVRETARNFVADTDLSKVEALVETSPQDPRLPILILERISSFFDSGVLVQRWMPSESPNWWITDVFWRGNVFHLDIQDQVCANKVIHEVKPTQVQRAPADKILKNLKLPFLNPKEGGHGYLMKPTPNVAYILFSQLPDPWAMDHVGHAHRLISKCFVY